MFRLPKNNRDEMNPSEKVIDIVKQEGRSLAMQLIHPKFLAKRLGKPIKKTETSYLKLGLRVLQEDSYENYCVRRIVLKVPMSEREKEIEKIYFPDGLQKGIEGVLQKVSDSTLFAEDKLSYYKTISQAVYAYRVDPDERASINVKLGYLEQKAHEQADSYVNYFFTTVLTLFGPWIGFDVTEENNVRHQVKKMISAMDFLQFEETKRDGTFYCGAIVMDEVDPERHADVLYYAAMDSLPGKVEVSTAEWLDDQVF